MRPRLQFSLASLFCATLWASVGGAAFALLRNGVKYEIYRDHERVIEAWLFLLFVAFIASPFAAVGAFFRRSGTGFIVGIPVAMVVWWLLELPRI